MTKVQCFEDLQVWKLAREFSKAVYLFSNHGDFSKDFGLQDQMRRAAVSVMSNIAEGFERRGDKEFLYFLSIAKGSIGELRSQLHIAFDVDYLPKSEFDKHIQSALELSRVISGLMRYLKQEVETNKKH